MDYKIVFISFCLIKGGFISRHVPRKPRPSGWGPCLTAGRKGHNVKGNYLTGKPRPLGRGASILNQPFPTDLRVGRVIVGGFYG